MKQHNFRLQTPQKTIHLTLSKSTSQHTNTAIPIRGPMIHTLNKTLAMPPEATFS